MRRMLGDSSGGRLRNYDASQATRWYDTDDYVKIATTTGMTKGPRVTHPFVIMANKDTNTLIGKI